MLASRYRLPSSMVWSLRSIPRYCVQSMPTAVILGSGPLGFRGPWGTTYPPNLRLTESKMREDAWVKYAKALKTRPPMPWFNLNAMSEPDLRAMYRYIRNLGPTGKPAQAYLPPDKEPKPPYIQWPAPPK